MLRVLLVTILFLTSLTAAANNKELSQNDLISLSELKELNEELSENIWIKRYNNYLTYRAIETELAKIKKDAKKYGNWKGEKWQEKSYQLKNKLKIKENELELMSEYKDSPIGNKIKPHEIQKIPEVTNPFAIIEAISYIELLEDEKEQYIDVNKQLIETLSQLKKKEMLLESIVSVQKVKEAQAELKSLKSALKDFNMVVDIVSTTQGVYSKKIEQLIIEVDQLVNDEIFRTARILFVVIILFAISFGLKVVSKKYVRDDDQHYTTNKIINFVVIVLSLFIVLFSYIENASYLVTFLGFASAGIAIALKDWFMSLFGWMAIMTSGAIHVGDRIKVRKDGTEVVGDVLDISLLKISIREDVTLTTYMHNRRAGRVFFIPNNYIFTDLISNYTYSDLRTVWDGVDVYITFDSNHKKAVEIAKKIAEKHSHGYTELAKKRLQKMKEKYVLRTVNPEPRVFTMVEPYGIVVTTWFQTNSYATLPLRSKVSMDILDAYNKADDITIAYPTQTLRVSSTQMNAESMLPGTNPHTPTSGLFDGPVQ